MENIINPFVEFMGNYDLTTADYTKIYDEYTSKVQFEIESETNKTILNIMENNPTSIIITGNAGDGKTRICRNVYTALTGKDLNQWNESGIEELNIKGKKIRIIKDLSELQDSVINDELIHLKNAMKEKDVYYLIAANEGKLTHALLQNEDLLELFNIVVSQLTDPAGEKHEKLHVYNLLHSSSSIYARKILEEWNEDSNWSDCNNCKQQNNCIIYHNHQKLQQTEVRVLLNRIYRSLDTTQVHMTIRELLIQLAYLHLGGVSCTDIHNAKNKDLQNQSRKVYYENLFGHSAPDTLFEDIPAFSEIQKYDPGLLSNSKVDDFILNGDLSGDDSSKQHKELFEKSIDTEYGFFQQDLLNYRSISNQENAGQHLAKYWLPRLRRKYYFEINTTKDGKKQKGIAISNEHSMIAYKHRVTFLKILGSKDKKVDLRYQKDLIRGLNYYFSKQLVSSPESSLYVVSDKLFVHRIISNSDMRWGVEKGNKEIDYKASYIYLNVDNITLKINLVLFEYLMRLANGGLPHILNDDVEILLSNFKNNLIISKHNESEMLQILKFNAKKDAYELREIEVSKKNTNDYEEDVEDEWGEDDFD